MIQRNTPELFVRDVDEAVHFYRDVLGFEVEGRMPEDAAQPAEWAMVKSGAVAFMFGGNRTKPGAPDTVVFYLAVENADQSIERLHSRGEPIEGPVDQWYGMREATVTDPSGYKLVFTSAIPVAEQANV
jgi:uncharacterized glyoxalase superfamily protein PhnB